MKTRQHIVALCFDKRGRLLSVGKNNYTKTHPIQAKYATKAGIPQKIYLHAEIDALLKVKYGVKPHKMVIIRRSKKTGELLPSKPCPVCQQAIEDFNIKELEYAL